VSAGALASFSTGEAARRIAMGEAEKTVKTDAEAQMAKERAKAAELDERLDKLEKEALPERPEPDHVDQAIGT
jgi:hypothetical protein